ncbi:MAG TPA: hypothetical protein VF546_21900 [Pyrinomonadaceae bacterium]|jgi:hypothetical protein
MSQPHTQQTAPTVGAHWRQRAQRLFAPLFITALPCALTSPLWLQVWRGTRPRATNGSAHYAVARLYAQALFPDTFGWLHAYFGGMPFPNFYPPLFYWLVALLERTHLVSFDAAFKLAATLPLLLLPAAIWALAWRVAGRQRAVATCAAAASLLLFFVPQFQLKTVSGLDYFSTLVVGLYTQPLGFLLLLAWFAVYAGAHRIRWRAAAAALLLALTLLANFFNAITAALFIAAVLINDLWRYRRATDRDARTDARRRLAAHFFSPLAAAALALFWLGPMLNASDYLVTRPFIIPLGELVTPALCGWYAVACVGLALGLRRAGPTLWAYSLACLALGVGVVGSGRFAPRWFPLQSYRFLATLDFLLAVPVGLAVVTAYRALVRRLGGLSLRPARATGRPRAGLIPWAAAFGGLLLVGALMARAPVQTTLTYYQRAENEQIDGVLKFAATHRDGRYLVELPDSQTTYTEAGYDSRALSAYLGLQGNESLGIIFREASPAVLFVNPQTAAFSARPDNHGISSVLADDLDYAAQPTPTHLARARLLGAKYLVVATPTTKERLLQEPEIAGRFDAGAWSVFELRADPTPPVRALAYRPALVVSSFSVKARRQEESGFVRLVEEQFADNWFDVLLARAPDAQVDRLRDLEQFGALVLDTYDCADESAAYDLLRAYAQQRTLVLLASDAPLYRRIERAHADFSRAVFIPRTAAAAGPYVESLAPSRHYTASARRADWHALRAALEQNKLAVQTSADAIDGDVAPNSLRVNVARVLPERVPVVINTTFHPNWRRDDGETVYATTPFAMLTFVDRPTSLTFARRPVERVALYASAAALCALCGFVCWPALRRRSRAHAAVQPTRVEDMPPASHDGAVA